MSQIGDDRVRKQMIDLNELIPVDAQFLMKFYFRAELASAFGQPLSLLNEPIESFLRHISYDFILNLIKDIYL